MSTNLTYNGAGTVTGTNGLGYHFAFASLKQEHIQVTVVNPSGVSTTKAVTTDYTIESYNANGSSNAHIKFLNDTRRGFTNSQSDANSYKVKISRQTPADPLITYTAGASVTASDLNTSDKQALFLHEENKDNINTLASGDSDGVIQINGSNIANNSITTNKILDLQVGTDDLANLAVTTGKIADDAVTTDKLANSINSAIAANTAKVTNATHTGDVTGSTALTIANNAITTAKIQDGQVTQAKINSAVVFTPVGTVIWFAGTTAPTGYLKCNGDAIPNGSGTVQGVTADFSALYAIVSANVPDLRGEFIRGWDDGKGTDSGRGMRTFQSDAVQDHQHQFGGDDMITSQGGYSNSGGTFAYDATSNTSGSGQHMATKNQTGRKASETRPRNVSLLACIKY
tara:strand:+ start:827 stop:2026 length:1200 start_codon:yes stop_codon:yes gene_type:complete